MNIHLTLPQEKLTVSYLVKVLQELRGLSMRIRCHWLHFSFLVMKLFRHNKNYGITKTGEETSKEDLQLQRTGLLWLSWKCYCFHLYVVCISLTLVVLLLHLRQCCHSKQHSTIQITWSGVILSCVTCTMKCHFTITQAQRIFSADFESIFP